MSNLVGSTWCIVWPKLYVVWPIHCVTANTMHYGRFECHPKIFYSINYQLWLKFEVQLSLVWLKLLKNELHFCNGDKLNPNAKNFNPILAKWHSFAHSAMGCVAWCILKNKLNILAFLCIFTLILWPLC